MFEFLKKIKIGMMASAVITTVMGLVLLLNPLEVTATICSLIGWIILIFGVFGLLSYFVFNVGMVNGFELGLSIVETLLGLYIAVNPGSIVKFVFLIIAVILFVHGVEDFNTAMQMKRSGYKKWWVTFLLAAITMILGAVALAKPFESTALLLRIIGASLLFDGISDLFIVHKASKVVKAAREKAEPIDVEARIR